MSGEATHGYSPYRWPLHILTVSYFLMGFIVRFAWPPLAGVAGLELGMDMTRVGSYMSAFYIGYVLMHIPAGVLGDRFGVRGMITIALAIEGIATIGMGFAGSYMAGFVWRLLAGLGAGMAYSACIRCVSCRFPPKEYGPAFGFLLIAPIGGGVLLPNLLMPWLAAIWEWRGAFVCIGIAALALACVALLVLRDMGSAGGGDFFAGLRYILGKRVLIMLSLAGFCLMWSQISFVSWGNSYLKSIGFSLAGAGRIMTIFGIGGCIGPLLAGFLSDRMRNPKWIMILAFICLVPLVPWFGTLSGDTLLMPVAGLCGLLFGLANPPLITMIATFAGRQWSATAGGVSGCIFQCGAILGPLLAGYSIDKTQSHTTAWWIIAAGALVAIAILLPIPEPPRQ
jgi:sugar phosphate permease